MTGRLPRLALLAALATCGAAAQPGPLVWERVGDVENVDWLTFRADTLYAGTQTDSDRGRYYGVAALRPGEDWVPWLPRVYYVDDMAFGDDGLVYSFAQSSLIRSTDGGQTFAIVFDGGVQTMPFEVPDGGLIVGINSGSRAAARSDDDGVTWAVHDGPDLALPPYAFAVPGAAPHRVVGVGFGGIGVSDDGGRTWAPTPLQGDLAYAGSTVATVAEGPNDGGRGGALVAVLGGNGGSFPYSVVRSVDGVSWEVVGPSPYYSTARLLAAPDGALYLYSVYFSRHEDQSSHPVYRSTDGGTTWEDVGPVWDDWWAVPSEIVVGPDGRLWASANGHYQYGRRVGGVFRTVDPVYAVAGEGGPAAPEAGGLALLMAPNPAGGAATIRLSLAAQADVRVAVFDAVGREVGVVWDGPAHDGQRVAVETGRWAPGMYVVGAAGEDGATATARLTVVR